MPVLHKQAAKSEIDDALRRHQAILSDVRKWCVDSNTTKESFYYLSAIPIIYSAWEGYFRVTCAICLRRQCTQGLKVKKYTHGYATLWLQRESFVETFFRNLFNSMTLGRDNRKINSGRFQALANFAKDVNLWLETPLNHSANFDELVMTYSNVNPDVVKLNCDIIGIDISTVDFSKLNEVIGRRNDIAHGGLIQYPSEGDVVGLIGYTDELLKKFHGCARAWLAAT